MLNLTPHEIRIMLDTGETAVYPPSGMVARVLTDVLDAGDETFTAYKPAKMSADGEFESLPEPYSVRIPIIKQRTGAVIGLPSYVSDLSPAIVSPDVAAALPGAPGVYAPDTGPTAIRDASGQIIAVRRLIKT